MYQVVYIDSKFWNEQTSLIDQVERTYRPYLLECPLTGIFNLGTAKRRARKLKIKYGPRIQIVILGQVKGQFGSLEELKGNRGGHPYSSQVSADYIKGLTALQGMNALGCTKPKRIFTEKGPVFYPDLSQLREGIMLLQVLGHNLYGTC